MHNNPTNPTTAAGGSHSETGRPNPTHTRVLLTKTSAPIPISDPEERKHRSNTIKSFSQPLSRGDHHPASASALALHKKKQHSLEFPLSIPTSTTSARSLFSGTPQIPQASSDSNIAPLPEFTGSGGGTGIFKLPPRAPLHPGRPPPLEVRPHPLRETQVGYFLRSIACTSTQLWAATECGVRFWEFSKMFGGHTGRRVGDEESAPFRESSRISATTCLVVDERRGLIWTGHKDGRIRSWRVEQNSGRGDGGNEAAAASNFKDGLSWHAHRWAVLSLVVTSNGTLLSVLLPILIIFVIYPEAIMNQSIVALAPIGAILEEGTP